ncbi:hypothetical protein HNV08_07180 [Winogradskyella eckloniae]|nr:hypothetical protein [Winogradskyella eckloniae]NRD19828.1 hypothetical protein [Winogradskyella eckloniae]
MNPLHILKNRLQKLSFGTTQKTEKGQSSTPKQVITKAFSKDEDTFMFI